MSAGNGAVQTFQYCMRSWASPELLFSSSQFVQLSNYSTATLHYGWYAMIIVSTVLSVLPGGWGQFHDLSDLPHQAATIRTLCATQLGKTLEIHSWGRSSAIVACRLRLNLLSLCGNNLVESKHWILWSISRKSFSKCSREMASCHFSPTSWISGVSITSNSLVEGHRVKVSQRLERFGRQIRSSHYEWEAGRDKNATYKNHPIGVWSPWVHTTPVSSSSWRSMAKGSEQLQVNQPQEYAPH